MICGHKCTKKCGEECGPCLASCLSSCKHQECGTSDRIQTIKYGRNCSQPCVLCPRFCDNNCQHRSCGKRCYEICDVKPCEEPCGLRLMCGHACLGMCGEKCPSVCGTCRKQNYISIINEYLGTGVPLTKLPRIIEIEGCQHAFPVEFLDKHVTSCQESSTLPLCPYPGCGMAILHTQRYAKVVKKLNLDKYNQRVTPSSVSENMRTKLMNGYWNTLQKERKNCEKIQQTIQKRKSSVGSAEKLHF
ncbi:hypothetical protein OESDEN_15200 [Oesophagostomum dentatum]|uniref:NF-X1 type zinc finger n=1 Tax=Oesophagostomum dentatum TaxID=61180 RepID=A0A0B1SJI9_OESDE|nr:hypothetical protein OESDEN_15200 [Oesophagostomum dentatum]